jgi:16S rRNA (adenine1518-N6/adenine1519-N6)-dimethyltransferase
MFYKKKSLGQSFLIDSNIAKKIVSSLTLNSSNYVIEVGPGKGILTKYLVNTYKNVYLIEIDRRLIIYLKYRFPKLMHNILHKNFLYWIPNNKLTSFGLIGNFPYYISSEIILKILSIRYYVIECVGMFQKEFADKLIFKNNKYFNSLSVLINAFYNIEFLFSVDKCYFTPQPRVISYVLRLKRKKILILIIIFFTK